MRALSPLLLVLLPACANPGFQAVPPNPAHEPSGAGGERADAAEALERQIEELEAAIALEQAKTELKAAESGLAEAERALEQHQRAAAPLQRREAELDLRDAENALQQQQEELDQLLQMFGEDELAKSTEDIVLARARRALQRREQRLELARDELQALLSWTLPHEELELQEAVREAQAEAAAAKLGLKLAQLQARLALLEANKGDADGEG